MSHLQVNPKIPPFPTDFGTQPPVQTTSKEKSTKVDNGERAEKTSLSESESKSEDVLNLLCGKTYRFSGLKLPSGSYVNGNGAIILCGSDSAFVMENATNVRISDCFFVGNSFSDSTSAAISAANSSFILRSCTFRNMNTAVKMVDCYQKKASPPIVETCAFEHCGYGIMQTGDESFSLIRDNCFEDCHIGVFMAGGNYDCVNNIFDNCQCCLFRVKPSYSFGGPCIGSFMGNTCRLTRSSWPKTVQHNEKSVELQAVVFDDEEHAPPLICSSTFVNCCPHIANCKKDISYSLVGCSLLGTPPLIVGDDCKDTVSTVGCIMPKALKRKREDSDNDVE